MIPIRTSAIILGLLFATHAKAAMVEFDLSAVSIAPLTGIGTPNPLGFTATASFTLDSSAFALGSPYYRSSITLSNGTIETVILASALLSFSADLTTPVGFRHFGLSDVDTACSGLPGTPCFDMVFDKFPSEQIAFATAQDGFTNPGNPSGFVNIYAGGSTFHDGPVRVDYAGTWTGNAGAPISYIGSGLPGGLLLIGGLIFWARWRRRSPRSGST
jgi:hypothetical protein